MFGSREDPRVRDEVRFHRDRLIEDYLAAGMDRQEAERRAFLEFGNVAQIEEACRDARGRRLDDLRKDVGYGLRKMRAAPAFTIVAVAILAIAIGANTAVFSVIDAVLLRMLPVERPRELRELAWVMRRSSEWKIAYQGGMRAYTGSELLATSFAYPVYAHLRDRSTMFADVFLFHQRGISVTVGGRQQRLPGLLVSGNAFRGLGVKMTIGRPIAPDDDRADAPAVVVLTHGLWQRMFGGDSGVLGRTLVINGMPAVIVGVTARTFEGLEPGSPTDAIVPLSTFLPKDEARELGNARYWRYGVMGRVKAGVDDERARIETEALIRQALPPGGEELRRVLVMPASHGLDSLRRNLARSLYLLGIIMGVVLLIACANIAGLLLMRGAARERELAVRLALGAGRARLVRQLLTESALLASVGGALGIGLAFVVRDGLLAVLNDGEAPPGVALGVGPSLLVFAIGLCLAVGLLCGVLPALRATRLGIRPVLTRMPQGAGSSRLVAGKALITLQVALSLVLLVGAGLFVRTLMNLRAQALGFQPDHILLFEMDATANGYNDARLRDFYDRVLDRVIALPDVRAASLSRYALLSGGRTTDRILVHGAPEGQADVRVHVHFISPRHLETMGIPLLAGRDFTPQDRDGTARVGLANESLAKLIPGAGAALGRRIRYGQKGFDVEIVGMTADARFATLRDPAPPTLYLPFRQYQQGRTTFALRVAGDPLGMVAPIRRATDEIDPNVALLEIRTQEAQLDAAVRQERLFAYVGSAFALLAVGLACLGIYGTLAYAVTRRTSEIGVRMALGANRSDVVFMVLRESLVPVIVGIGLGLGISRATTRFAQSLLFGLTPHDGPTLLLAAFALIFCALLAAWLPSRRASSIDPIVALRCE
jgi:predicted permease